MKFRDNAKRDTVTVTPRDLIDRAIELMEENGFHHLVVVDNGVVVGMLSDRDILISTGWMLNVERSIPRPRAGNGQVIGPTTVGQIMTRPVVWMSPEDPPSVAALLMVRNKISAVPVLERMRLEALITETDLIQLLDAASHRTAFADRVLRQSVRNKMRIDVVQAGLDMPLENIVGLFRARRIRHIPVVEDGSVRGIISDRDLRRAIGWSAVRDAQAQEEGRLTQPEPRCAAEIMKTPALTIDPCLPLGAALHLMLDRGIHSLPVVEAGRLVGIFTQSDLVRIMAEQCDVVPDWSLLGPGALPELAPITG